MLRKWTNSYIIKISTILRNFSTLINWKGHTIITRTNSSENRSCKEKEAVKSRNRRQNAKFTQATKCYWKITSYYLHTIKMHRSSNLQSVVHMKMKPPMEEREREVMLSMSLLAVALQLWTANLQFENRNFSKIFPNSLFYHFTPFFISNIITSLYRAIPLFTVFYCQYFYEANLLFPSTIISVALPYHIIGIIPFMIP